MKENHLHNQSDLFKSFTNPTFFLDEKSGKKIKPARPGQIKPYPRAFLHRSKFSLQPSCSHGLRTFSDIKQNFKQQFTYQLFTKTLTTK